MVKLERSTTKLIEKGLIRHSVVQAIIVDFLQNQQGDEKARFIAESVKETMPSLLASKQGLQGACALFNILEAKDRKFVIKSLKDPLKEMLTNKIAHLFIIHIVNTLDDT